MNDLASFEFLTASYVRANGFMLRNLVIGLSGPERWTDVNRAETIPHQKSSGETFDFSRDFYVACLSRTILLNPVYKFPNSRNISRRNLPRNLQLVPLR
jgi:hypothetical protein